MDEIKTSKVKVDMSARSPEFRNGFMAAIWWLEQGDPFTWKENPPEKDFVILEMQDGGLGDRTYMVPLDGDEPVHTGAGVVL